ncbi:MAG: lysophospholipid acyltransferase family protein [Acidobacteriota bacterium]
MLATLRTVLVSIPAVSVYTLVCGSVSLLLALVFRSGEPSHRVARLWAWLILKTCGVKVSISGLDNVEPDATYVFAANHQSLFDIPILFAHLPMSFRILYKQSLNAVPFLGWHLFLSGHISVDRGNPVRAHQSIERAAEHVGGGTSVVIFPEGTRSFDGSLGRFKPGSFWLAVKAAVPVVPVTICGSWKVMSRGRVTVRPGTVRVHVDRPILTQALDEDSVRCLSRTVREVVGRNYGQSPLPASSS